MDEKDLNAKWQAGMKGCGIQCVSNITESLPCSDMYIVSLQLVAKA